jgi:hypothetical protein
MWRNNFRFTTPLLSRFFHWLTPDLAIEIDGANILRQVGVNTKEVPAGTLLPILRGLGILKTEVDDAPKFGSPASRRSSSSDMTYRY